MLGAGLSPVIGLVYASQPDALTAVTLLPCWVWFGLVGSAMSFGVRVRRGRLAAGCLGVWLTCLLLTAEEARSVSVGRQLAQGGAGEWRRVRAAGEGRAVRIVSLNCGGGSEEAAMETVRLDPDIVLLQESPGRESVQRLSAQLNGDGDAQAGLLWGPDTSLVVRGSLMGRSQRGQPAFILGHATLKRGGELDVVSLRLAPPVLRFDYYSPDCWREQQELRRVRRRQLEELAEDLGARRSGGAVVVGGDFNSPAGDGCTSPLGRLGLSDSFRTAGAGWGATALNDFPVARIDQIWHDRRLRPALTTSRMTRLSDHRMVVCDALLVEGG